MKRTGSLSVVLICLAVAIFCILRYMPRHDQQEQTGSAARQSTAEKVTAPVNPEPKTEAAEPASKPVKAAKPAKPSSKKTLSVMEATMSDKEYARGEVIDPSGKTDENGEFVLTGMPDHLVIIQERKGDLYGTNYVKARVQDPEKSPIVLRKLPPGMDPMGGLKGI